jgi:hypothetical protein
MRTHRARFRAFRHRNDLARITEATEIFEHIGRLMGMGERDTAALALQRRVDDILEWDRIFVGPGSDQAARERARIGGCVCGDV